MDLQVLAKALLLSVPSVALSAQSTSRVFHHLTVSDGLAQNSVNAVLQDKLGFLWFGTQDGLDRFDGRTFVHHRNSDRANSLSNNYIWALHEDLEGAIWIGTFGGGLDRFDPMAGVFTHFRHVPGDTASLPSDRIFSMAQGSDGRLWLGTNNGLASLDPATRTVRRWMTNTPDEADGKGHFTSGIALFDEELWARTDSGLTRLDTRTGTLSHFRHGPHDATIDLSGVQGAFAREDGIVVCCDAGLVHIDPKQGRDTILLARTAVEGADPRMVFSRLFVDGEHWWIGTSRGLVRWHRPTGAIDLFRHDTADPNSLAHDIVLALQRGAGGELWIGTRSGLDRLDGPLPRIRTMGALPGDPRSLVDRAVSPVAEDAHGNIWIGTNKGLNVWLRAEDRMLTFRAGAANTVGMPGDHLLSLLRDGDGMLLGTLNNGMVRAALMGDRLRCLSLPALVTQHGGKGWSVHALFRSSTDELWVGTAGSGICRVGSEGLHCYPHTGDNKGPSHPYIFCIAEDAQGGMWFGTPTGGLDHFDPDTERFVHLLNRPEDRTSLSNDLVLSLFREADTLWVGTLNGLNRLVIDVATKQALKEGDGKAVRFERFGRSEGLPNEVIYGMVQDKDRHLWMTTNNGIAEFDPTMGQVVRVLTTSDGLRNDEFNQNGFLITASGEMFFGGVEGLSWFRSNDLVPNGHPPPVHFTRFLLNNAEVPLRSDSVGDGYALPGSITGTKELALSWRDKVIGFEFAALNFIAPEKNRYRYRLEGFDEDWVDAGTRNTVTYTNLDPGAYVLRVQGSNNDGVWNVEGASLALSISTPPWRTWYAYSFYALVLLSIGYGWYRHRLREATREMATDLRILAARNAEREDFRKRSAADFHDESGAKLTRINLHTGLARRHATGDVVMDGHLEHIERAQRELSAGIRDLIWSMDPDRDSLDDVLDRLAAFALSLFDGTDTLFRIEGRTVELDRIELGMEQRRAITLIMKEAMNNCAKHAQAAHCTLSVSLTSEAIRLRLKDDGKGFDRSDGRADSYGTRTMPERANSIRAELMIESAPGAGTLVTLTLPRGATA